MNSSEAPIIKINICTDKEIDLLYGIGLILAERIITYRNSHGYFRGPEDLAKVEGISLSLAMTLSPQIDWEIPVPKPPEKGDKLLKLGLILLGIQVLLVTLDLATGETIPMVKEVAENSSTQKLIDWLGVVSVGSRVIQDVSSAFLAIAYCYDVLRDKHQNVTFLRIAFYTSLFYWLSYLLAGPLYLLLKSFGLGIVEPDGQSYAMMNMGFFISGFLIAIPVFLIAIRPRLVTFTILKYFVSGAPILGAVIYGIVVSFSINSDSWPIFIGATLFGFGMVWLGIMMLRTGNSLLGFISELVQIIISPKLQNDIGYWQTWINIRIPNPEDQKALRLALNTKYPLSKSRKILAFLIMTIGGWIILAIFSSTIDWIVQGWLNKLFAR